MNDLNWLAPQGRLVFRPDGTVVPPKTRMEDRWHAFLVLSEQTGSAAGAIDSYEKVLATGTGSSTSRLAWLDDVISQDQPAGKPDVAERFSRAFRAASRLSRRFDVTESSVHGVRYVEVDDGDDKWLGKVPVGNGLNQAVGDTKQKAGKYPRAELEMELQSDAPEEFMLFAVRDAMKSESAMPYTCLVIDIVSLGLAWALFEAKAKASVKRPSEIDTSIHPCLPIPEHSSWPGGHAFGAGAVAVLLDRMTDGKFRTRLANAAVRISERREDAGLHTTLDTDAGLKLGSELMSRLLTGSGNESTEEPKGLRQLWTLIRFAKSEWK